MPRLKSSHLLWSRIAVCVAVVAVCMLAGTYPSQANPLSAQPVLQQEVPVNFTAKTLSHDDEKQTVTATGDVELVQGNRVLRADKMVYYLSEDRVTAMGNVSLLDERGDVHFAEYVELHNKMKDGFVQGLLSLLADGSRFTAAEAKRENNGTKTTLTDATYTVCKVCEADPHPLWQIKAKQVVHDVEDRSVKYKHARMEFMGVPVIYSPIFSHPDPTQKRKSGFLRPEYGWSNQLGTHVEGGYYYDIAPDKDMTMQVEPTTLAGTVLKGQWRERFVNGQLKMEATTANSDRHEEDGRIETSRQRGNIFADGRFDLDEKWRSGFDLARTTDKEYLRLYDISKENVLDSQVYAERFSGRDYSRISAMDFQDVRLGVRPDQPYILPLAEHTMIGEPNSLWGGRWQIDASALGLLRDGDRQDMQRGTVGVGWQRHGVSHDGFDNTLALDARADAYGVQNSDAARINPALEQNPNITRGIVTAGFTSGYPLAKTLPGAQAVVEPVANISVSPNINNGVQVPDEDSVDVQFDRDNLFSQNRFPGLDRAEDGGRANYGVKTGLYADDGRYGQAFIGESYRLYGRNPFPQGSGLETENSDIVGQIKAGLSKYLDADYHFQLDKKNLAAKRHEIIAGGGNDRIRVNTRYFYTSPIAGTGFAEGRQQVEADTTYNLNQTWKWRTSGLVDLGDQPGLRSAATGLEYADECFTFSVQGSRNVADTASGDNDTKILLRIGFKSIGEFSGPQIPVGQRQQQTQTR